MAKLRPSKKKGNKPEIVPVGTDDAGYFYFQKLGYLKAGEILEITKYEGEKKKGNALLSLLINKIAKDKNIEPTEAAKYIFPTKMQDGTEVFPPDHDAVLSQYPEEIQELGRFSIPTMQIHNFIANLFLSGFYTEDGKFVPGRVAFQVEATEEIALNDTVANFEAIPFLLPDGSAIKFGQVVLRVDGNWDADSETVVIKPAPGLIPSNSTGFLFDVQTKNYILGNEDWGINDTIQLPQQIIDEIYNFYRVEAGLESSADNAENSANNSDANDVGAVGELAVAQDPAVTTDQPEATPRIPALIGEKLTLESNDTESQIHDSRHGKHS